jgi:hypothetical protein
MASALKTKKLLAKDNLCARVYAKEEFWESRKHNTPFIRDSIGTVF